MNRTAFSLPEHSDYRTSGGLAISRAVEQFTGNAKRLDFDPGENVEIVSNTAGILGGIKLWERHESVRHATPSS